MIKFDKEYSPSTQMLINELRLAGYQVGVPVDSNLSGDMETEDVGDMLVANDMIDGIIPLNEDVTIAYCQIIEYADRYKITKDDLDYDFDDAVDLLRDASPEYVARLIGKEFPVYVLAGTKTTLIITRRGNYYNALPGMLHMAKNILLTPIGARASKAVSEKRMVACRNCPFILASSNRCVACGCFLNIKTSLADSTCPKGKWP